VLGADLVSALTGLFLAFRHLDEGNAMDIEYLALAAVIWLAALGLARGCARLQPPEAQP